MALCLAPRNDRLPPVLTVISPAKKLDFAPLPQDAPRFDLTRPEFFQETQRLAKTTRSLCPEEIKKLMKLSDALAELNFERFQQFDAKSERPLGSKQAALAFNGDTYTGLQAGLFNSDEMDFAQEHLGILSGLYGILRPLDAIQPYRLEMGTRLKNCRGKSLYEFWGDRVAGNIDQRLDKMEQKVLINLASTEYFSVIPKKSLKARVITPVFKELRDGTPKIISFSAKKARGTMARFIIQRRLKDPEALKKFRLHGYRYEKDGSTNSQWLFLREQPL